MGKDAVLSPVTARWESPRPVTRGQDSQKGHSSDAKRVCDVVGIHWLRGSIPEIERRWLTEAVCLLWGSDYESHQHGFWVFDRHLAWPSGVKLLYHSTEEGAELTNGRIALEVPGSAIEQLDTFQTICFMDSLNRRSFQCSRLDVYFDDLQRTIRPAMLYQQVYEESLFEGAPIRHDIVGFRVIKKLTESTRDKGRIHDEVCFGKRGKSGTGKYVRCYDKALESHGDIPGVRWELELSDYRARAAFKRIVATLDECGVSNWTAEVTARTLGGLLAWAIDFKIRKPGVKNLKRLERHAFWQSILDRIGRAALATRRLVKTVQKAREWLSRQVAGTLQMLREALGEDVAIPLICDLAFHNDRLRPAHKRAISEYIRLKAAPAVLPASLQKGYVTV